MASQVKDLDARSRVLDIGAGYGGSARYLAKTYGCQVMCLNLSEIQNQRNRDLNRAHGLSMLINVVDGSFEDIALPDGVVPTNGIDEDDPDYAVPGADGWTPNSTPTTGTTVSAWLPGRFGGVPAIDRLRVWKRMDNQLTAYQMNTGDKVWSLPVGQNPDWFENHPLLEGVDVPNTGGAGWSIQMVMGDLLVQTRALSWGGTQIVPDAPLELHARDKRTGEILGSVELPAPGQYGMMTYMHEGKQYILVQIGSVQTDFPGALVAYALP